MLVLRFQRSDQEYKTPLNFNVGRHEIPAGLVLTTSSLSSSQSPTCSQSEIRDHLWRLSYRLCLSLLFVISELLTRDDTADKKKGSKSST